MSFPNFYDTAPVQDNTKMIFPASPWIVVECFEGILVEFELVASKVSINVWRVSERSCYSFVLGSEDALAGLLFLGCKLGKRSVASPIRFEGSVLSTAILLIR